MAMRDYRKYDIASKLVDARIPQLDVMVVGATGAGKSSTLNAILDRYTASVGTGVDPETMDVRQYRVHEKLVLWDTPGLGDSPEKDRQHIEKIKQLLKKFYRKSDGVVKYQFIDMVLVIVDGSSRDLGTTYHLLEKVILPNIQSSRIIVGINQADVAMSGRHWDASVQQPDTVLEQFLQEKALSVKNRVFESVGFNIQRPICYSAKYGYHLDKVMDSLIDHMPESAYQISQHYVNRREYDYDE